MDYAGIQNLHDSYLRPSEPGAVLPGDFSVQPND
jgi:hypothetical protein